MVVKDMFSSLSISVMTEMVGEMPHLEIHDAFVTASGDAECGHQHPSVQLTTSSENTHHSCMSMVRNKRA